MQKDRVIDKKDAVMASSEEIKKNDVPQENKESTDSLSSEEKEFFH